MTTLDARTTRQPLDIDAIRARAKAATEAPWHRVGKSIQADAPLTDDGPSTTKWNTTVVCSVGAWGSGRPTEEDAEFIAHARTDVPEMADEVERLRAAESRRAAAIGAVRRLCRQSADPFALDVLKALDAALDCGEKP